MKKYTYLHSQTRYAVWEVYANSEEEADGFLFDESKSECVDNWSKNDEVELRLVEDTTKEVTQ